MGHIKYSQISIKSKNVQKTKSDHLNLIETEDCNSTIQQSSKPISNPRLDKCNDAFKSNYNPIYYTFGEVKSGSVSENSDLENDLLSISTHGEKQRLILKVYVYF